MKSFAQLKLLELEAIRAEEKAEFKKLLSLDSGATPEDVLRISDLLQLHDQKIELGRSSNFDLEDVNKARKIIRSTAKQKIAQASSKIGQELAQKNEPRFRKQQRATEELQKIDRADPVEQADAVRSTIRDAEAKVRSASSDQGEDIIQ